MTKNNFIVISAVFLGTLFTSASQVSASEFDFACGYAGIAVSHTQEAMRESNRKEDFESAIASSLATVPFIADDQQISVKDQQRMIMAMYFTLEVFYRNYMEGGYKKLNWGIETQDEAWELNIPSKAAKEWCLAFMGAYIKAD